MKAFLTIFLTASCAMVMSAGCGADPMCGGKPMSFWLKQAEDKNASFRAEAIRSLKDVAIEESRARERIVKACKDESASVRQAAVAAIGVIAKKEPDQIGLLIEALGDEDGTVRHIAVTCIRDVSTAEQASEPLGKLLDSTTDSFAQDEIVRTLQSMGRRAKPAIPSLKRLCESRRIEEEEADKRWKAIKDLASFSPKYERDAELGGEQWGVAHVRHEFVNDAIREIEK